MIELLKNVEAKNSVLSLSWIIVLVEYYNKYLYLCHGGLENRLWDLSKFPAASLSLTSANDTSGRLRIQREGGRIEVAYGDIPRLTDRR